MSWEAVIGLEVHCQLETKSKLFSPCPVEIGAPPNTRTDPYTWGLPGTLPVPNEAAVRFAIALALATDCRIASAVDSPASTTSIPISRRAIRSRRPTSRTPSAA